jgi:hypothetical protein
MLISQVIKKLAEIGKEHGDIHVAVFDGLDPSEPKLIERFDCDEYVFGGYNPETDKYNSKFCVLLN